MTDVAGHGEVSVMATNVPEILSSVKLPLKPNVTPSATGFDQSEKLYRHVLPLRAVNPRMDLVAIVSRDINNQTTGAQSSQAGLPPPPAGLSAARSQALMRMRMAARAKALAAAGLPAEADPNGASAASGTLKVARCATLRLSLWRMASVAGEQGTRVWDIAISIPERFEEAVQNVQELEDMRIEGSCWSPDGLTLALIVTVIRRDAASTSRADVRRHERFACLYALHDGKRLSVVPIGGSASEVCTSLEWCTIRTAHTRRTPGSADHLMHSMEPLPSLKPQGAQDQESKSKQRQRMFHTFNKKDKGKEGNDKKAEDLIADDPRGLGKAILEHPRYVTPVIGQSLPPSANDLSADDADDSLSNTLLQACFSNGIHLLLDGTFYLGKVDLSYLGSLVDSSFDELSGSLRTVCLRSDGSARGFRFPHVQMHMLPHRPSFSSLRQLTILSTHSFNLVTYAHDAVVQLRTNYKELHEECIAPWNRQSRVTSRRYATDLSSEMIMLLCAGHANDTMQLLLLGNEALSEKDLRRMARNTSTHYDGLIRTARNLINSLQRLLIVFEEVNGCTAWHEQFGILFGLPATADLVESQKEIASILQSVSALARQSAFFVRDAKQEATAWKHFYTWWMYERARQEALRDKKSPAEAIAAAGGEISYDVVLLLEFLRRGFENVILEQILDITLDAKTRGTEVEDDDEEEDEEDAGRGRLIDARQGRGANAEKFHQADQSDKNSWDIETPDKFWFQSANLGTHLQTTAEELAAPPTLTSHLMTRDRRPPNLDDLSDLYDGRAGLYAGPSSNLRLRLTRSGQFDAQASTHLMRQVIEAASRTFVSAFSRWTQHVDVDKSQGDISDDRAPDILTVPLPFVKGKTETLESLAGMAAERSDAQTDNGILLRVSMDAADSEQRIAFCLCDEDSSMHQSIVIVKRHLDVQGHTQIARLGFAEGEEVRNLDFFTIDEVAILLFNTKLATTKLVTLRIDEIAYDDSGECLSLKRADLKLAHYSRVVTLDDTQLGGAGFLSTNKFKDACATLDDQGHLTYWDMVLQQSTQEVEL
jgi:hypothetical protein